MTDAELIRFALLSGLDTETLFGLFLSCLMDEGQAAAKFEVGTATIRAWYESGKLGGFKVGDSLLFLKDAADPRTSQ